MNRAELQAMLADLRAAGVRAFKGAGIEVEFSPDPPAKSTRGFPDEPSGMPTREELFNLKDQIDKPTKVGP